MKTTSTTTTPSSYPFIFAKATQAHQEHPERNEDYLLTDRASGLAVLCDGVGYVIGAGQASRVAAHTIKTSWKRLSVQPDHQGSLDELLQNLLHEANEAVIAEGERLAQSNPEIEEKKRRAETTITLALITRHSTGYLLGYAHVGDSRIYLLRPTQALQRLTVDDGYFLWMMNKGEMNAQDAWRIDQASTADQLTEEERAHFDNRNRILQSLGAKEITLHIDQLALCPGDRVLLCSDGIHDNLTDSEIEAVLRKGAPTMVARTLLNQAIARSRQDPASALRAKKDDMSAIVVTYL